MSSPNRNQARAAFGKALEEARGELNKQILKLRMDMIQYPHDGNYEPFYSEYERCPAEHANSARPSSEWLDDQQKRDACPRCKAISERYWRRDSWKKGRGATIQTLKYRIDTYKRARRNYWAAGGHTSWGADRFT